ncbi:MAG: ABC transporter substrate-binding protein [Candidatus Lokiarchaeota archaeon]
MAVALVASGVGNIILGLPYMQITPPPVNKLVVDTGAGPVTIDPQDAWDSASADVLDNVFECLYTYNLSDPNLPIIPRLASAMGTWSGDNFTVPLRQGVTFQDGSAFTSADVVWSFNRMLKLMSLRKATAAELYEVFIPSLNETVNVINKVVANGPYSVTFVLNTTYGPFVPLLCFEGSMIMKAGSEPFGDNIDLTKGTLMGTGPWIYKSYEAGVQVTFNAYKNYWRGAPHFDQLIFDIISESSSRNIAMLSGDTDIFLSPDPSLLSTYNSTPGIDLVHVGPNLATSYLGMNCKEIPRLVRKAMSYAFDYNYVLKNVLNGFGYRMKSPIPKGIEYWNYSFNYATFNITTARKAMIAEYAANPGIFDNAPPALGASNATWEAANCFSFNYTYNTDNNIRAQLLAVLQNDFAKIGINVIDAGTTWANFVYSLYEIGGFNRQMLQLYWIGWIPDYNDGSDYINPLFTNRSVASNGAQFNNATVQRWMEQAILTVNKTERQILYNKIQDSLVSYNYPWVYGFTGDNFDVWKADIHGFPSNSMGKAYFYPCYRE